MITSIFTRFLLLRQKNEDSVLNEFIEIRRNWFVFCDENKQIIRFSKRNFFVFWNETNSFTETNINHKTILLIRMLKEKNKLKIETKQISKNQSLFVLKKWLNFSIMKIVERSFSNLKFTNQFLNMSFFDRLINSRNQFFSKRRFFAQFFQKFFFSSKHFRTNSRADKKKIKNQK